MVSVIVFSVIGFVVSFLVGWFVGNIIYKMELDGIEDDSDNDQTIDKE